LYLRAWLFSPFFLCPHIFLPRQFSFMHDDYTD
jgi:hypothetical protein